MNKLRRLRLYFWVFLALNLAFIAWSRNFLQPLQSRDIVQFEIAKHVPVAERIMGEWKLNGKFEKAQPGINIDYIFILLYTGALMTAVLLLSRLSRHILLMRTGRFISMILPVAAICDIIENIAMTRTLSGHLNSFNVALAYDMAVAKFSIIILTLIFLFICLLFWIGNLFGRRKVMSYEL
jgi:hypothetical protein